MGKMIKIEKRNGENIACWRVDAPDLTPNTEIAINGTGLMVLVRIDGEMRIQTKSKSTVYALFNPGKDKKLFGGKPYKECEIDVVDQSSEFFATWGFGNVNPLPCKDFEFDVECNATARGKYSYKIENIAAFLGAFPMRDGVITQDDIREFLRDETSGVIKAYLSRELLANDMQSCKANIAKYSEDLSSEINSRLESKGLTVYNFLIENLDYASDYLEVRGAANSAKINVGINNIINRGKLDDISVEKAANDVIIPRMKAAADIEKAKAGDGAANNGEEEVVTYCRRCGERNTNSNYCRKCGEKLV